LLAFVCFVLRMRRQPSASKFMTHSLILVLDTNVVLDWLVFRDAAVERLRDAIEQQRVRIVTHTAAIEELRRVLAYPQCKLPAEGQLELLSRYRESSQAAAMPADFALGNLLLPANFPRCRDADDQHFLALA
jgi:uncharacterized protein